MSTKYVNKQANNKKERKNLWNDLVTSNQKSREQTNPMSRVERYLLTKIYTSTKTRFHGRSFCLKVTWRRIAEQLSHPPSNIFTTYTILNKNQSYLVKGAIITISVNRMNCTSFCNQSCKGNPSFSCLAHSSSFELRIVSRLVLKVFIFKALSDLSSKPEGPIILKLWTA